MINIEDIDDIEKEEQRLWYHNEFCNNYLLRLQSMNFIIGVHKKTGEYVNLYIQDNKEARQFLADVAEDMEKHPAIIEEESDEKS